MTFFKTINTKMKPIINNFIFRDSHHHSLTKICVNHNITSYVPRNNIIINLLGDIKSVDTASWEIQSLAKEKILPTANIVFDKDILNSMLYNNSYLEFIVNRCYNMSCDKLIYLNQNIVMTNTYWKQYNLYVLPDATNRFNTCQYIKNCKQIEFIVYPLSASEENKRRDIHILIDN